VNKIRALVVDDEPIARERVLSLLQQEEDMEVVAECGDGPQAVSAIQHHTPDLVFLDVQMPGLDAFGVINAIGAERMPTVIFITAYDEYALRAFEVHALDYLLKPFNRNRFADAVARVREHLARARGRAAEPNVLELIDDLQTATRHLTRFVVRAAGRLLLVDAAQVDWIEAADNYAVLHAGAATHLVRETMAGLATELDPERFVRIHRSTIVQIDRVRELQPAFHGDFIVLLRDGTRLNMSRGYRSAVEAVLGRSL
jgi:two-component system, LytTR family, response regulator